MMKASGQVSILLFVLAATAATATIVAEAEDESSHNKQCSRLERMIGVSKPIMTEVIKCKVSADCENYPYYFCTDAEECEHKHVFPQKPLEVGGLFVFGFIMALCTVAGIGGGGIATSMIEAFFKFETKPAVAVSSFSILICTTMRFFYNFRTKHPEKTHMNVLDYGLASIMMPTTLAGSQIGGYILLMFPSLYIQIALTLLLLFLSYQTFKKAMQLDKKEKAEKLKQLSASAVSDQQSGEPLVTTGGESFVNPRNDVNVTKSTFTESRLTANDEVMTINDKEFRYTSGSEEETELIWLR